MENTALQIGEIANRSGVSVDTVRYYEKLKILPTAPRTSSGYRMFPSKAVEQIKFIKQAQELGFSLDEIKKLLVSGGAEAPVRRLIYELFLKHRRKKTVATALNDLGYRTRNKARFSDTTIDRLLRDTTAKGIRIENGKEVSVDPLVATDVWERVNSLLGNRALKKPINLFAGVTFCKCGGNMFVPHTSRKYVCTKCRHKIPCEDLEAVFHSQLEGFEFDGKPNISEVWHNLNIHKKRTVVEMLCESITVARESIAIRFACDPASFKTPAFEQRMKPGNETSDTTLPENAGISPATEPLLGEAEAAHFLGVSKMTMLRKRQAGIIGFYRVGFRVLYSKEKHLLPYLATCEKRSSRS